MTLGFTQKINGKPNYFIEKIWMGLLRADFKDEVYHEYMEFYQERFGIMWDWMPWDHPALEYGKNHTIREDIHNRWKPGMDIHFVINNRTPKRFQFAPIVKCKSVQDIEINYSGVKFGRSPASVIIDGFHLNNPQLKELVKNDGFESVKDFFAYFTKDFKGKIIHWTDLKY